MKLLLMTAGWLAMLAFWGGLAMSQSMHVSASGTGEALQEAKGDAQPCLSLWLELAPEVQAGKSVTLTLKLRNICDHPLEVSLGGRPAHDFVVTTPDGTEVWRWSYDGDILMILEVRTVSPQEELTFTAEWNQRDNEGKPVAPGSYQVRGSLRGEPPQIHETAPAPLLILP